MMTVSITINNRPIYCRTVVNRILECGHYICDDGTKIKHNPNDGVIKLAIKALKTIKEVPSGSEK